MGGWIIFIQLVLSVGYFPSDSIKIPLMADIIATVFKTNA